MIHVARSGQIIGQFAGEEVSAGLTSGKFLTTDHCWTPGSAGWITLREWKDLPGNAGMAAQPSPPQKPAVLAPAGPVKTASKASAVRPQPVKAPSVKIQRPIPARPVAPISARPATPSPAAGQPTTITVSFQLGLVGALLVIAGSLTPFIRIGPGSLSLIGNGDAPRGWLFIALAVLAGIFSRTGSMAAFRCATAAILIVAIELAYHLSDLFRSMSPGRGADRVDVMASAIARSMFGIEFGAYILAAGCICLLFAAFKSENK